MGLSALALVHIVLSVEDTQQHVSVAAADVLVNQTEIIALVFVSQLVKSISVYPFIIIYKQGVSEAPLQHLSAFCLCAQLCR